MDRRHTARHATHARKDFEKPCPATRLTGTSQSTGEKSNRQRIWTTAVAVVTCLLLLSTTYPVHATGPGPAEARNVDLVGHIDIEGGGMIDVHDGIACIGHVNPPFATSILDVSDPTHPRIFSRIKARPGTHSHKARICGNIMIVNYEQYAASVIGYVFNTMFRRAERLGLGLFDVSDPSNPEEIGFLDVGGVSLINTPAGVHRFQFDCKRNLAYISATAEGYRGNIVMIIDLSDPSQPEEVGRWWLRGQWLEGGEKPSWKWNDCHVHHPNRLGDRLYVPMWFGGLAIVDIANIEKPKTVSYLNPRHESPIHTTLPVEHKIMERDWLVVFDEDITDECEHPQARMWLVDITDEEHPKIASSFGIAEGGKYSFCDGTKEKRFGSHQPHEFVGEDNLVYAAWFAGGLRIIDISNPYEPTEVGYYVPEPVAGFEFPQSNDVFIDDSGLIYLIDRNNGLDILRYVERDQETEGKNDANLKTSAD